MLAALMLYFFENNTGTRAVLVISLLVPLLSMGCACITARKIRVSLSAPDRAGAGEKIRCRIKTSAPGWLAGCTAVCIISVRNRLTGEQTEAELPLPLPGETVTEAVSDRCGCLSLAAVRTEVRDWFGLICRVRPGTAEASVIIGLALYPVDIRKDADAGAGIREAGASVRTAEDPEPGDLRPYLPGDPVRRIHWKLSEKTDQTLIRESAPEALELTALLLETSFPEDTDPEAMHAAAGALLSVSRAMAAEGIAHSVITAKGSETAMTEVTGEESFRAAEEQVLTAESRTGGTSIGTLFRQEYPDIRFHRVLLFSPHPGTDGIAPAERQPVTLVLPAFIPFAHPGAGVRVTALDPADARIDL